MFCCWWSQRSLSAGRCDAASDPHVAQTSLAVHVTADDHSPFDPRLERFAPLTRSLRGLLVACAALALAALVLPDPVSRWAGLAMFAVLVGAPVARVLWLVQRWFRRGDVRFASVGLGVLAVIASGVLLAALGV